MVPIPDQTKFDFDGSIDALVTSSAGLAMWRNDGTGHFQFHHVVKSGAGIGPVIFADFESDGDLDLTYADGTVVQSMVNDGQGNFTVTGTPLPTSGYVFSILGSDILNDFNQSPTIGENTSAVTTIAATDPDGDTLTYSIVGGYDAAKFQIDTLTGVLRFIAAPDFENPGDTDADNQYVVDVQASDGKGGAIAQTIRVTVSNRNDNAPVFFSGAAASIAENTVGVAYDAEATDADNLRALIYTLSVRMRHSSTSTPLPGSYRSKRLPISKTPRTRTETTSMTLWSPRPTVCMRPLKMWQSA
ncbi:FG-GAP-like repeat-containing protein [Sinorhizobium fredii]|uniref:FG-GAP-like repeat-containing protein n=1 Tax=Rhizobium fredii TaxID=380 RepID=UPI00210CAEB2|nr:FG-GAP-like repeat-containing protein [Sinorhizobium fredii]UTY46782.1 hypothetical protein EPK84_08045 [Sinorhizobium fredii]